MNKYLSLFKYEAKTILRDPISLYMCFFPVIILILSAYVFPMIFESMDPANRAAQQMTILLLLVFVIAMGSYFIAAMATFLLIENKDECTLHTIAVTPIGTSGYIQFKMAYVYIMSVISTIIIILGTKLIAGDHYAIGGISLFENIGIGKILSFSIVSALFVPALALLQGALAKNKIEGFAFIKGTGMIAMIPMFMILEALQGGLQYILGIFPNFWTLKGIMLELFPIQHNANLSYGMYLLIGTAYNIFILMAAYRLFMKKAQY